MEEEQGRKIILYAPNEYHEASYKERDKFCNGCGAEGGVKVPDKMWGLNIKEACNIHDWMTAKGKTLMDFLFAAGMFILNLTLIIWSGSANKFMLSLRLLRATKYFIAVVVFGVNHFFKDKKRAYGKYISYTGSFQ